MERNQKNPKSNQNVARRAGAISLSILAATAVAAFFLFSPAKLAQSCSKPSKAAAEMVYEVVYDRAADQVRAGWVWE